MIEKQPLFENYPYRDDKRLRISYWIIFVFYLILISLALYVFILGFTDKDEKLFYVGLGVFLLCQSVLFALLTLKNKRLRIYSDRITTLSLFGKERIYKLNTKKMTIVVTYTDMWSRGIKLTFLARNKRKILSHVMLEFADSNKNIQKRRKIWGEELKKIGCSIEDRGSYLMDQSIYYDPVLDEYIEKGEQSIRKEDIEYVRKILKRNAWLFPLFFLLFAIFYGALDLLLNYFIEIESYVLIAYCVCFVMQILASFALWSLLKRRLRLNDEELMKQEFSKRILEKRK